MVPRPGGGGGADIKCNSPFNNRSQEQIESIDTYVTALRALAKTCEFGTLKDHLIRDRIVCGVRENAFRRKLLQKTGLTLSKYVDICRVAEATSAQLKKMAPSQQDAVGAYIWAWSY